MSTQIVLPLSADELAAPDEEVAQGRATSRPDAVRHCLGRLSRDQRYRVEDLVLVELARRGELSYPYLDALLGLPRP